MGKRILKIPKHYANLLPRVTLQLPSMRVRILIRKLYFLAHLLTSNDDTLGPTTFRTLAMCNVDDISLVQQCRWLESHFTHDSITDRCLRYPEEATSIIHKAEVDLLKSDKNRTLTEASKHRSLKHILNIKCWLPVWDKALDRGCAGTIAIQKLIRYLATPVFNDRCQYCTRSINPTVTCAEHLIICKSLPISSPEHICTAIENFEDSVFGLSKVISNLLYTFHSV